MNGSGQKGERKKKITEVKTFPVPFAIGEIKENISISTNTPSEPSREELINQAFKFHSQGNISEAAKYYQQVISQGCNDHRIFSYYGAILRNHGKLQDAELSTRKAIEINPDFVDAHFNLGTILSEIDNFFEFKLNIGP